MLTLSVLLQVAAGAAIGKLSAGFGAAFAANRINRKME